MKFRKLLLLLILPMLSSGQQFRPSSPLGTELRLAGTFCELRSNHYHSGIDIKTGGVEGEKVYAVADGFICRIKISSVGFGRAIYIHHPEGKTTVYGHLNSFIPEIEKLIDSLQQTNESFECDFQPDSLKFPVKRGQLIGWSGNSGGSEGPHLHFEIRDRFTEEPLNPLAFNLPFTDTIPPLILRYIPYYLEGRVWKRFPEQPLADTVYLNRDTMGFAIRTIDPDSNSKLGIYRAEIYAGDSLVYAYQYDRFNFNDTRMVNAHLDYQWWVESKERVHRLFRLMNDDFPAYKESGTGKIPVSEPGYLPVKIVVQDFMKNTAVKNIVIEKVAIDSASMDEPEISKIAYADSAFNYTGTNFTVHADAGSFYQDETLKPATVDKSPANKFYQSAEGFYQPATAVHKPLVYHYHLPAKLRKADPAKIILLETDLKGEIRSVNKAVVKKDSAEVRIRKLALLMPGLDLEEPVLKSIKLTRDTISNRILLKLNVADSLSGIGQTRVIQNGRWVPSYYELRDGAVYGILRNEFPAFLEISITDNCENILKVETGI